MKKKIIIVLMLFIALTNIVYCKEGDKKTLGLTENLIMEQLDSIDLSEIEELINSMNDDNSMNMTKINIKTYIMKAIKGELNLSFKGILIGFIKKLFKEIIVNSKLLSQLIIISVLCSLLNNLTNSFGNNSTNEIAFYACYLVIAGLLVKAFTVAMNVGQQAIDNMVSFMQSLMPILLSLLMAAGSITSSAIFKPIMVGTIGITSTIMRDIILPLIFLSAILAIVNNLPTKIHVSKLASLIKQGSITLIGLMLTIFFGVVTIEGVLTSSTDGVTLRTAKFAVDSFIPIVGGFMSDAVDTVLGCSLLIKNAVGVVGLIIILTIVTFPILKILSLIIIYKITAVLIEPISDTKIVNCINDMSNALVVVFATVISVAIMFFIAITAVVGAGNITAMIR
ncbi:stage III sporulation protein AE [Paramaledivibacter caminithermalis]|jgi:stage III sporulation protein AE|uniref:Stage III sporulation protein AE n=1 Tax=Paramaledivibacter caminithermalis (strain DSM 15212 / CIP 107654 / DViRD3) TaxID=1121301 RepID=A0A1M6JR07_PARC5|nr:stage III sporulation protein AE [Paramaledivibacter caminithermalis]SHJ49117.1 stage III sporulation protein AE [Paramaledivibacter caminithermalis DSM 15212]